ncbi:MAG: adenylate/guanylate cyclase domain-containing protein [Phaeodactylibacter sp.]|nr:adenylate/guanylate cyclase domain-containing protein [Phaeodactylibacter sp.]
MSSKTTSQKKEKFETTLRGAFLIAFLWAAIAVFQATYEFAILANYNVSPGLKTYIVLLKSSVPTVFIAGLLAGLLLLPRVNSWLRTHAYGPALLLSLFSFMVLYFLMSLLASFIYNSLRLNVSIFDEAILPGVYDYLTGMENLKNFLFWLFVATVTILSLQINDKYGPGVLWAFILGRYFHPRTEDRAFMFLDIRSSTTIAEQLEELQYFEFIKDFFQDATPGILMAKGAIYQYVGDEIVVSWPLPKGLENNNCIHAFFEIRKAIQEKSPYYQKKYGVAPSFKVGLHCGTVVTGEIGVIKKDLAYSGDVLNTTARIQSKCNELGVDILLSETLFRLLNLPASGFREQPAGEVELRGKAEAVQLYSVEALTG